jgi:hypothetical protein
MSEAYSAFKNLHCYSLGERQLENTELLPYRQGISTSHVQMCCTQIKPIEVKVMLRNVSASNAVFKIEVLTAQTSAND